MLYSFFCLPYTLLSFKGRGQGPAGWADQHGEHYEHDTSPGSLQKLFSVSLLRKVKHVPSQIQEDGRKLSVTFTGKTG